MPRNQHQLAYSSHLPLLIHIITHTTGDVLELGMGFFSTPVLHWLCSPNQRTLVSYDNNTRYSDYFKVFENEYHKIVFVDNWDDADIEWIWDVVFIDHAPAMRRKDDVKRVANLANYVIIHDSDGRLERSYHYYEVYPLFKYLYTDKRQRPHTTVLSNFVDVRNIFHVD